MIGGYAETLHILHSDYDFNFVKNLPYKRIVDLLIKARERKNKNEAWDMWLSRYPNMTKDNFESFSDYYKRATTPPPEPSTESISDRFDKFMKE